MLNDNWWFDEYCSYFQCYNLVFLKMAALAGDLSKAILGQSDAAKAFRPWWDVLEDNLLYSFVIFGEKISN